MFQDIQQLSDILPVRGFYIALLHHSVMQGGVNLFMSQQLLHLFDGHSFVNGGCSHPGFFRGQRMNCYKVLNGEEYQKIY